MGFFSKLFNNQKKESKIDSTALTPQKSALSNSILLNVHPDIRNYIWIGDGKMKNYTPQQNNGQKVTINGVTFTFSFGLQEEPSLIFTNLPIATNTASVERPPYFPIYKELSPAQRGMYWKLLANPYDSSIDIGYVFILYYGLERYLLTDKYEEVINILLKLRDVHTNASFQSYSANAIILTCLVRQRADLVIKFMNSLDKEHEYSFSDNLFLLCKYCLNLSLTVPEIIRLAKSFEFTKTTYIKNYPDTFSEILTENVKAKYNGNEIPCEKLLTKAEFNKLPKQKIPIFANISIRDRDIEVPQILTSFKFKKDIYFLLEKTHEEVKSKLAELRKKGTAPEKKATPKKLPKEVLSFDTSQETLLLSDYKKAKIGSTDQHFALIALQNFYYKYRAIDDRYLELCIKYCLEDISNLAKMQNSYLKEEEKRINDMFFLSKTEKQNELNKITAFDGTIPAFKRLAITYEKAKDFDSAINICGQAINYYTSIGMLSQANEFQDRQEKLLIKKSKLSK